MLRSFKAVDFRCLRSVEVDLGRRYSLVIGANASGKTSFLEALAYLGRGKSFRGANTREVVRHGCDDLVVFGETESPERSSKIGASNGKGGLQVKINGEAVSGAAALASELPLQVIDPEVHNLVSGGPEQRRRFLDWVTFHVEPNYLQTWRSFRRILKQRNAGLRGGVSGDSMRVWNREFIEASLALDQARQSALAGMIDSLKMHGALLLDTELGFEYRSGWAAELDLESALDRSEERERQTGATQVGPHRADVRVIYDDRAARRLVSRGQQKLLASAMILAASKTAQAAIGAPLLLLLDDPAAELDQSSVSRLLKAVAAVDCQVIATSLEHGALEFPEDPAMFHVEQGVITPK